MNSQMNATTSIRHNSDTPTIQKRASGPMTGIMLCIIFSILLVNLTLLPDDASPHDCFKCPVDHFPVQIPSSQKDTSPMSHLAHNGCLLHHICLSNFLIAMISYAETNSSSTIPGSIIEEVGIMNIPALRTVEVRWQLAVRSLLRVQ